MSSGDLASTATLLRGALERVERQLEQQGTDNGLDNRVHSREPHTPAQPRRDTRESESIATPRTELRRMFYQPDLSQRPQRTGSTRKKRRKANSSTKPGIWKKEAICLRYKEQRKGPNLEEKMALAKAGLGLKELTFSNDGDALHIHHVINEAFKELDGTGGYTLLRLTNNSTTLLEIEPPKSGVNVKYLKDILKSAKLFIRPLQVDINIDDIADVDSESEVY